MKQLKFLKNIYCDGKPVWYEGCCYDVVSEGLSNEGRRTYKLFCEDLKLRGIDTIVEGSIYKVIEIEEKKEEIKKTEKIENSKPIPNFNNNDYKKKTKTKNRSEK